MTQLLILLPFQLILMDVGVRVIAVTLMGAPMEAEENVCLISIHRHTSLYNVIAPNTH